MAGLCKIAGKAIAYFCLLALFAPSPLLAQELLINRSFEDPVAPNDGNNAYISIAGWTVTKLSSPQPVPFNIVRPFAGYSNNATTTPPGGELQYLDINGRGEHFSNLLPFHQPVWWALADGFLSVTGGTT